MLPTLHPTMEDSDKNILKKHRPQLAADIIVDDELLGALFSDGVFEEGMIAIIKSKPTAIGQVQALLDLLPKRGPKALIKFIKVIEKTSPWLATTLKEAREQARQGTGSGNPTSHNQRNTSCPTSTTTNLIRVDGDIKQIVATFLHRQFGQSRRFTEIDKRNVSRFLSDQIQIERNRYQQLLCSPIATPDPDRRETPEVISIECEVRGHLYSIHNKLESFIDERRLHDDLSNEALHRDGEGRNQQRQQHSHQHTQDDMDFNLIHEQLDIVLSQTKTMRETIDESLLHFDTSDRDNHTLSTLVGQLMSKCRTLEEDSKRDNEEIKILLDERELLSDTIDNLERKIEEYRRQIRTLSNDIAAKNAKHADTVDKLRKQLDHREHQIRQQQQQLDRQTNNTTHSLSKSPTTPRTRGGGRRGGGGGGMTQTTSNSLTVPESQYRSNTKSNSARSNGNRTSQCLPGALNSRSASANRNSAWANTSPTYNNYQGNDYPTFTYEGVPSSPRARPRNRGSTEDCYFPRKK